MVQKYPDLRIWIHTKNGFVCTNTLIFVRNKLLSLWQMNSEHALTRSLFGELFYLYVGEGISSIVVSPGVRVSLNRAPTLPRYFYPTSTSVFPVSTCATNLAARQNGLSYAGYLCLLTAKEVWPWPPHSCRTTKARQLLRQRIDTTSKTRRCTSMQAMPGSWPGELLRSSSWEIACFVWYLLVQAAVLVWMRCVSHSLQPNPAAWGGAILNMTEVPPHRWSLWISGRRSISHRGNYVRVRGLDICRQGAICAVRTAAKVLAEVYASFVIGIWTACALKTEDAANKYPNNRHRRTLTEVLLGLHCIGVYVHEGLLN